MATEVRDLEIRIKGDTSSFENAMRAVNGHTERGAMSFGHLAGAVATGQAAFAAAEGVLRGFAGAIEGTIKNTEDLGLSTLKLQRETGMTAEEASGLLAVFERFGVDSQGASKSLGLFAKQINAAGDASNYAKTPFGDLGIQVKDTTGHLKSTQEVLLEVSDKFKNMPDGVEKTAEAMKLFGRSGKDMLPILNQGRDGIMELEAHAKKMGVVLSQDNVDAVKKNMLAQKDLHEAMLGLQLTIGTRMMPAITAFSQKLVEFVSSDKFRAWINQVGDFLKTQMPPILNFLTTVALPLLWETFKTGITVLAAITDFFNKHREVLIAVGIIVGALTLQMVILKTAMMFTATVQALDGAILALGGTSIASAAEVGGLTGAVRVMQAVAAAGVTIGIVVLGVAAIIAAIGWVNELHAAWDGEQASQRQAIDVDKRFWDSIKNLPPDQRAARSHAYNNSVQGRAVGGPVSAGQPYLIGEKGPELFIPDSSGTVITNEKLTGAVGNAGANPLTQPQPMVVPNITVEIGMYAGEPGEIRNVAQRIYLEITRIARSHGVQMPQIGVLGQ